MIEDRHRAGRAAVVVLLTILVAGCGGGSSHKHAPAQSRKGPYNLGSYHHRVTTASPDAQAAFDRGLTLSYAFSHRAAEEEFRKAIAADPSCAMAWWGVALVNGPHINFPMVPPQNAKTAWEALTKARSLELRVSEPERAYIEALAHRYAMPQPEDRAPLDAAYANAMREMWRAHPDDPDAGALCAEALMDLHPWDLWRLGGTPQPWEPEIQSTLERVMRLSPRHAGANHFYIHVMEASPHPEKALASANLLRDLVPGAGHLVHMPAHIYSRVGEWPAASLANRQAIVVDSVYRAAHPHPGLYAMYMAHNRHFLAYADMMQGDSAEALKAAREMVRGVPPDFIRDFTPVVDGYMIFVSEALMRFGRWQDVLAEPQPPANLPLSRALWYYTRAAAYNALGRAREADAERDAFRVAATKVPKDWTFGNNPASAILAIAGHVLDGEIDSQRGRYDESIRELREAVRLEDGLRYDEPPDWMQPARHTLGAVLLRAGRYTAAEAVYREDLARWPENGWSLFGLSRALRLEKKDAEAAPVEARFRRVWAQSDIKLGST
jgi:tetratricopeptide (TPR) repeat protein